MTRSNLDRWEDCGEVPQGTAKRSLVYRDYTKDANAPLGGSNSGVRHDRSTLDSHEVDQMREP